ncbi:hypothetical protein PanWU01x14_256890 [Parasponia andersonii]|uniref:Uncharacterized protein n=1 Tax=Parasponia andersonii TaxID=3476 RepID=A0A2P5BA91_PARAD|nr:hypothetical protein PanWU01x14_256890 [Parasponia andersonii]
MGYSEDNKMITKQYVGVPTSDKPTKQLDYTAVDPDGHVSSYVSAKKKKKKKKKRNKHWKRSSLWFCCSNVEFENDELDKHKVLEFLENNNNNSKKNCLVMCCTNIEMAGPKV